MNYSKLMREDPLFTRNEFTPSGRFGIPLVRRQVISLNDISLIAYSDTKKGDNAINKAKGVHFFIDDYRFRDIYRNPERSLTKLSQYKFLLTPDYSLYSEMQPWRQIESVAHSRWCGAFWQSKGLTVVPTISWSTPHSFQYCFDGVEIHSTVSVGMIGCKRNKLAFLRGYESMLEKIEPNAIICFGEPFPEMKGNLISIDYLSSRKVVR